MLTYAIALGVGTGQNEPLSNMGQKLGVVDHPEAATGAITFSSLPYENYPPLRLLVDPRAPRFVARIASRLVLLGLTP